MLNKRRATRHVIVATLSTSRSSGRRHKDLTKSRSPSVTTTAIIHIFLSTFLMAIRSITMDIKVTMGTTRRPQLYLNSLIATTMSKDHQDTIKDIKELNITSTATHFQH